MQIKLKENKDFVKILKNVTHNDDIVWEFVKALTSDQVFEANKYFGIISTRLLNYLDVITKM